MEHQLEMNQSDKVTNIWAQVLNAISLSCSIITQLNVCNFARKRIGHGCFLSSFTTVSRKLQHRGINTYLINAPILYPLETPKNLRFLVLQGVKFGTIGQIWVEDQIAIIETFPENSQQLSAFIYFHKQASEYPVHTRCHFNVYKTSIQSR